MLVGLRPKQAAEFSFLLGLPTLGGACVYKALKSGDEIAALGGEQHLFHTTIYRPWGSFHTLAAGARYQVKEIVVKPGASISLQKHFHRAEHWVVVEGTARILCGDKEFTLQENESTFIPLGEIHRLSNPGKIPVRLIEVQSCSYLGEDDIVRLEDTYGRS